jgi:uncharacterized protein
VTVLQTTGFRVTCTAGGEELSVSARLYESQAAPTAWLILAHGAGAGQDHAFMVAFARGLAAHGLAVVTFNFPYIERGRRVPDPRPTLEGCWKAVLAAVRSRADGSAMVIAGGKSMGGRIASQVSADPDVAALLSGLVFLGYPLHPPGRPDQRRTAHWPAVHLPALFVQGSRDPFASPEELREELPRHAGRTRLVIVENGDHSFKVPRSSGRSQESIHLDIQKTIADWILELPSSR